MEHIVAVTIVLKPQAQAFEPCFHECIKKMRTVDRVSKSATFSLYRSVEREQAFVWITRFSEEELSRVSRSDWPFVILAMLDLLKDIMHRFGKSVSVASSSVLTAEGLVDQWNERHGRFHKMSLEA